MSKNSVIVGASPSLAVLQGKALHIAGKQLGIVARLDDAILRQRWVALLKRIPKGQAEVFLSGLDVIPWSMALIERFKNKWNWERLFWNKALPWSIELIERFKNKWHWGKLSWDEALPWSVELIERYEGQWDWERLLSRNEALPKVKLREEDVVEIMIYRHGSDPLITQPSSENPFGQQEWLF